MKVKLTQDGTRGKVGDIVETDTIVEGKMLVINENAVEIAPDMNPDGSEKKAKKKAKK